MASSVLEPVARRLSASTNQPPSTRVRLGHRQLEVCLGALLCAGCVVGAARRPTQPEAAAGPPPTPAAEQTAARALAPLPEARGEPDPIPGEARPGSVWMAGYWHWNGTRHVWMPGRWEPAPPVARP